jgi:hypothetical protein
MLGLLAALLFQVGPLPTTSRIASDLRARMQLVHGSGDQLQAPWVVAAVEARASRFDASHRRHWPRRGCASMAE